jgi:hypothetical protein
MPMLKREVITPQVLRGMEKNTQRLLDLVDRLPIFLRRIAREFAGVQGSGFYRALQSGKLSYRMYCFNGVKTSNPGSIAAPALGPGRRWC